MIMTLYGGIRELEAKMKMSGGDKPRTFSYLAEHSYPSEPPDSLMGEECTNPKASLPYAINIESI